MPITFFEIGRRMIKLFMDSPIPISPWAFPRTKVGFAADPNFQPFADFFNENEESVTFTDFWAGITEAEWFSISDPSEPVND